MRYHFEDFALDGDRRELRRGNDLVSVEPQVFDLLKGIVGLTRTLGLVVTIEGVETFEQLKILVRSVKPDLVQGFLFGAALSASGIETMSNVTWPFAADLRLAAKRTAR